MEGPMTARCGSGYRSQGTESTPRTEPGLWKTRTPGLQGSDPGHMPVTDAGWMDSCCSGIISTPGGDYLRTPSAGFSGQAPGILSTWYPGADSRRRPSPATGTRAHEVPHPDYRPIALLPYCLTALLPYCPTACYTA
jgi:hypothetical protein